MYTCNTYETILSQIVSFSSRSHAPVSPLPFSVYNYIIYITTRKFIFFSLFLSFKKQNWCYTSSEFLCSLQLIIYINIIIITYCLNCYSNWWQLASENPHGYSMCCLRTFCVFFQYIFILSQCTLYCYALCQIKYYHTMHPVPKDRYHPRI